MLFPRRTVAPVLFGRQQFRFRQQRLNFPKTSRSLLCIQTECALRSESGQPLTRDPLASRTPSGDDFGFGCRPRMTGDFSEYLRENFGAVWYDQLCEPEDTDKTAAV